MATPIKEWSKLEVRAVVRFLFSKGTKPSEIHKQIAEKYGEGAVSRSRVYQWCTWFREGRTSLGDEPKSGRPKTSTNDENTTRVDELIRSLTQACLVVFTSLLLVTVLAFAIISIAQTSLKERKQRKGSTFAVTVIPVPFENKLTASEILYHDLIKQQQILILLCLKDTNSENHRALTISCLCGQPPAS
ncbi:histone-lysine N-methyltransferase SETMAR [Plakobranchus ocellatus]|uniref:Histone-lysine N-methyltransferase SETMAR n=1 Tax=Plakobranchus ocellatus TaxID=259542 RepID=A0AAV4C5F8_9GAST|nr:histone-lysine N-methyltransferase SETMAR [Plakobranchus ocellatus]